MRLGSVLAGASEEIEEQMGEYGRNLGIAFQIVDDVLDLTATEQVLGKPVASDLREGKATLAVVHALGHATAHEHEAIRRVLEDLSFGRTSHQEVLDILDRHGSVQYALSAAFQYAEVARGAIAGLPESDYKRALLWMPDFVVARDK
jgi:octaprenyl-diphosphate synthase